LVPVVAVAALVAALAEAPAVVVELPRDVVVLVVLGLVVLARRPLEALPADRLLPATTWLLRALLLAVLLVVVALRAVHLAVVVAVPAVLLQRLRSRQSFSAAMARNTPQPRAACAPVPRSRWLPKGRPCPFP